VLANLDLFIVNVALPDIAQDFGDANLGKLSWILNGYAIVYAALLVFCGRLAERFPRNHSFLAGIALFTVASAACALANSVSKPWWRSVFCRPRARRCSPQRLWA
jgi:MFS family permease